MRVSLSVFLVLFVAACGDDSSTVIDVPPTDFGDDAPTAGWNGGYLVPPEAAPADTASPDHRARMAARYSSDRSPRRAIGVEHAVISGYGMLDDFLERYRGAPDDAKALVMQGESPAAEDLDAVELAAWTMLGSTVLSLDETLVRD